MKPVRGRSVATQLCQAYAKGTNRMLCGTCNPRTGEFRGVAAAKAHGVPLENQLLVLIRDGK